MSKVWSKLKNAAIWIGSLIVCVIVGYLMGITVGHFLFMPLLWAIGLIATYVTSPILAGICMAIVAVLIGFAYGFLTYKLLGRLWVKSGGNLNGSLFRVIEAPAAA